MTGFFSKKQYAAMADSELAMKLLKERCLECSICAIFFNSSLTVSIKARFDFVRYAHKGIFHIVLHFGYQLCAVKERL